MADWRGALPPSAWNMMQRRLYLTDPTSVEGQGRAIGELVTQVREPP